MPQSSSALRELSGVAKGTRSSCCSVLGVGGFGSVELRLWLCGLPLTKQPGLDPDCSPELLTGHLQDVLPREGLVGDKG